MAEPVEIVNLEEGMPRVEQAIKMLTFHINTKKQRGLGIIKIIHGFGSSGTGGGIRIKCRQYLESLKRRGVIVDFVPGESFTIFDPQTRALLDAFPQLRADRDLERHNNGVTIVRLK